MPMEIATKLTVVDSTMALALAAVDSIILILTDTALEKNGEGAAHSRSNLIAGGDPYHLLFGRWKLRRSGRKSVVTTCAVEISTSLAAASAYFPCCNHDRLTAFHLGFHSLPKKGHFRNAPQSTLILSHVKILACLWRNCMYLARQQINI